MNNIFFSSDHHFFHYNILKYCNRPFKNIEEMNTVFIDNWNCKVGPTDTVYYLGDFGFGKYDKLLSIFNKLNGNKILAGFGNHDKESKKLPWSSVHNILEVNINKTLYVLCHYPLRSWNKSHYGSVALHGHSHGAMPSILNSFDVGVDCWNYHPISLDEVRINVKNIALTIIEKEYNQSKEM